MALIIEDGTGVPNADSWATKLQADTYAVSIGNLDWDPLDDDVKEQALRRGARYITVVYGPRFAGKKTYALDQSLPYPREGIVDNEGNAWPNDYIPPALIQAQIEAALREGVQPGVLTPVTAPQIKTGVTIGPISVQYGEGKTSALGGGFVSLVDGLLLPLLDDNKVSGVSWLQRA
jgi:hypothetical protein